MDLHEQHERLPQTIGPYRLIRSLGCGGVAQVFLARRYGASGFEKKVAIKTLRQELVGDGSLERALIEEAKLGALFNHRCLVQVHDLGVDAGRTYVCMDYVPGSTLARQLPQRRPPLELGLFIGSEICRALDYVHRFTDSTGQPLGLVHRDLSPGNVLLSTEGDVKLADFGIAKASHLSDSTRGRFLKGTVAYMSPEQLKGEPLTGQSDQFAFGILLAELTSGRRPFDGPSPIDTIDRTKQAEKPDLAEVPALVRELIERCLQLSPSLRFPTTADLACQLEQLGQQAGPGSPASLSSWIRQGPNSD